MAESKVSLSDKIRADKEKNQKARVDAAKAFHDGMLEAVAKSFIPLKKKKGNK